MPDPLSAKIEAARKVAAQAKARLQALEAKANQAARKTETRRKVILGALLIDAAGSDPRFAAIVIELVQRISRDQDRKAFLGWSLEQPTAPTESQSLGSE
jgi:dihydroxyacetone kinase